MDLQSEEGHVNYRNGYLRSVLSLLLLVVSGELEAKTAKTIDALRIDEPIHLDGRLDEPAWARTQVIDDFIQQDPNEGQPITERTEVRVLYDIDKLYIGFECYDSEPGRIVANEMRRDGSLWQNDNMYVLLDTYEDGRQGFFFRTNTLGAQAKCAVTDGGQNINSNWDCIWESAGQRHEACHRDELGITTYVPYARCQETR